MEGYAMRKSGIEVVGEVPWGTHFCQFYETKQDLLDVLMPYFKAGLESNEFCMWITPSFFSRGEAEHTMRETIPFFDKYFERNQIEITPQTDWFMKDGAFNLQSFLNSWTAKIESVLAKGYAGFRASMNAAWLEEDQWKAFADYENKVNNVIEEHRMIAICTYPLDWYRTSEALEIISSHQFVLAKRERNWEAIESREAKKAKRALKQAEKSLETVLETSLEDIAVTDMEENLVYVNDSFANLLGYNRNELEGMHLRNLTDEKNYKKIRRQATLRKKGRTSRYEIQLQGRDGKPRPVQVSAAPLWDDMEVYVGSVGVITDLTENKRTQEEIRREQELLHALMDNIPHGIYFKDVDSRFTLINKAQAQILGVKIADQAIGKTDFDYFTKEHAQDAFKNEQRVMKTGQPLISKIEKVRRADGKFLWVSSTKAPIKNDDGKATGLVGISEDVTKLKLMEDSLAYERDLLEALMDNIPDAIYFKDAESRFVRVNSAHAHRMGLKDAEEARGKTDFDFYASEFAQNTYRDEQKVVKTGKPMIGDIEKIIQKDGKVRWVTATKMPLRDKDGLITGLVGISRDITTLKRMEEELRKYSEHLEEIVEERTRKLKEAERLATIGEATAMVGHDLRNPLQVIVNSVYLSNRRLEKLPSKLKIIKELREHIKTIEEQTIYMDKIVSDLQEYSIALKPQPVQVNLNTLIADTLSTIIVPEKIDIHLEIPRNLPLLLADPRLMKKVFANVITNGLQAMPYGGHLTIEASLEHEAVSIKVQDTGVGMSRETLRQIFQPFFTTKVKGQGLGLAVCKRLVEAQGGSIKVASEPGKGSTFTVNIPFEGRAPQIKEKIALDLLKKGQKLSTQFHSQH